MARTAKIVLLAAGVLLGALAMRSLVGTDAGEDDSVPSVGTSAERPEDLRPRVQGAVAGALDELGSAPDRASVEALLARLEAQARANGRVSALEVEPGLAAIAAIETTLAPGEAAAWQGAFGARMQALSSELRADGGVEPEEGAVR
jgi:hypothetical protein